MMYNSKQILNTTVLEDSMRTYYAQKLRQAIWVTTMGAILYALTLWMQFPQQPLPLFAFATLFVVGAGLHYNALHSIIHTLARMRCGAAEADLINRILSVAAYGHGEPETLLAICTELSHFMDTPQALMASVDESHSTITVVAERLTHGHKSLLGASAIISGAPSIQQLIELKTPITITDVRTHPLTASLADRLHGRGTTSMLIIPIRVQKQVMAILALETFERRDFTAQEMKLAQVASRHAGLVLATARQSDKMLAHVLDLEMQVAEYRDAVTEANMKLEEINRLDSQFASGPSHELYAPALHSFHRVDVLESNEV